MLRSDFLCEIAQDYGLTDKELEIFLETFGSNKSQQVIAEKLHLSDTTVRNRLSGVYRKFSIGGSGPGKSAKLFRFLTEKYQKSHPTPVSDAPLDNSGIDAWGQGEGVREAVKTANNNYTIHTDGGNYNESGLGNYIQGDCIRESPERERAKLNPTSLKAQELPKKFLKRPDQLKAVKAKLLNTANPKPIVGVWGMSGVGKSVLAAWLAQDKEVLSAFPDGVQWLSVGQEPQITRLQIKLAKAVGYVSPDFDDERQGKDCLRELLANKACLLILDDVWDVKHLEAFDVLGVRCRGLVTTQDAELLSEIEAQKHQLKELETRQSLELLAEWTDSDSNTLPAVAHEVAQECGNLPLALALCGAMVRDGTSWTHLLEALREADLVFIEKKQFLDYHNPCIMKALQVSVDILAREESACAEHYLELAVFPTDERIPEAAIQTLWLHNSGLKERHTDKWLRKLEHRALLQVEGEAPQRSIRLHQLQHKYLLAVQQDNLTNRHHQLLAAYRQKCSGTWSTGQNDGYFFQRLAYHLVEAGRCFELRQLLLDFNWLEAKLNATAPHALIGDYELLSDDENLQSVQSAVRLSAHVLAGDKTQLAGQLLGHLLSYDKASDIQSLLEQAKQWQDTPWLRPLTSSLASSGSVVHILRCSQFLSLVSSVTVTSDGKVIAGLQTGTFEVWNLSSGQALSSIGEGIKDWGNPAVSPDFVTATAVAPNGQYAISAFGHGILKVWDINSGHLVCSLGHQSGQWVSGGHLLAGMIYYCFHLGSSKFLIWENPNWIDVLAVTSNGQQLISGDRDGTVKIWDLNLAIKLNNAVEPCLLKGHTSPICALAVTSNGEKIISGSHDGTIKVWDVESRTELHCLIGHEKKVSALAVTPDGEKIISGSIDGMLKVWNLNNFYKIEPCNTLQVHAEQVNALAVTQDGAVISASDDGTIKFWSLDNEALIRLIGSYNGSYHNSAKAVAVTPDGRKVVSTSSIGIIYVLNLNSNIENLEERCSKGHAGAVWTVVATDNGKVISASDDFTLKIWDSSSGQELHTLKGHIGAVRKVAVTIDGKAISASDDSTLRVWKLNSGNLLNTFEGYDIKTGALAMTAFGVQAVSTTQDGTLKLWNFSDKVEILTLRGNTGSVTALAVTQSGWVVSGLNDGTLNLWRLDTVNQVEPRIFFKGHDNSVTSVTMTQDGLLISSSSDHTIKVWNINNDNEVELSNCLICEPNCDVVSMAMTKDEWVFSGLRDGNLNVWNLRSEKKLWEIKGHESVITQVAIDPNEQYAISVSIDQSLKVWNLKSGKHIATYSAHSMLYTCSVTPDGTTIVAGDALRKLHFLKLEAV